MDIRQRLLGRGVQVNAGRSNASNLVKTRLGIKLDTFIAQIYAAFDGFPEGVVDGGSCIRIWPINEVIGNAMLSDRIPKERVPFADFLMESERISFDLSNQQAPVSYVNTAEKLADSAAQFFADLAAGNLDFL